MSYPKRPQFFAHKFCRQLIKQAVAQEIGPDGFCLLTCVAMTEDAKGYTGAVTFFNGQLMPLCGFTTEKRLIAVRQKCVDAGWLHYQPGGKGVAGKYWCVMPVTARSDGPVDENPHEFVLSNSTAEVQEKCRETTVKVTGQVQENDREKTVQPTVILPVPIPSPLPTPEKKATSSRSYSPEFEEAWLAFKPSHRGGIEKPEAFTEWKQAVREIGRRDGIDEPQLWLLSRLQSYARSPAGQSKYSPAMCRWLKHGRYDDDPTKWDTANDDTPRPSQPARLTAGEHNRTSAAKALEVVLAARRQNEARQADGFLGFEGNPDGTGGDADVDRSP